jgi:preprotein translocase subunit SecD
MLNKYPLWKYMLILAVLAIGFIYSAPNLYPDDPAIQISGASTALQVNQADLDRVSKALTDAGIGQGGNAGRRAGRLMRLTKQEDQLPAKDVVRKALGDDYVVALNLAQTTPQWLRNLGAPDEAGSGLVRWCALPAGSGHGQSPRRTPESLRRRRQEPAAQRARALSQPAAAGWCHQLGFADEATREQARALIRKNFNDFDMTRPTAMATGAASGDDPGQAGGNPRILHQAEPDHRS